MPADQIIITLLAVLLGLSALSLFVLLFISSGISRLLRHFEGEGHHSRDPGQHGSFSSEPGDIPPEIANALRSGNKIQAIKIYRDARGCSLLDAKNAVEEMMRMQGQQ